MSYRRNAKKPKRPPYFPKKGELVAACPHVTAELNSEYELARYGDEADTFLFENQFNELTAIASIDGVYHFYYLCPQCSTDSFETFYLEIYPALSDITPENKAKQQKLSSYLKTKTIDLIKLTQLLRTHSFGHEPQSNDHIHICEHFDRWRVPIVIHVEDDFTEIEVIAGDAEIEQPKFLVFCPTCIADWDPDEAYEVVVPKNWGKKLNNWFKKTLPIYRSATEFFEWLNDKLEEEADDVEDYEYEGPSIAESVLLCDHVSPKSLVEDAEIDPIFSDRSPFEIEGNPRWIAYCENCTEKTDIPHEVASRFSRKKRLHSWTQEDAIRLVIEDIGDHFVFEEGLEAEPLANAICEVLERPDLFFEKDSPVWQLVLNWAPQYFDTALLEEQANVGQLAKGAYLAGEGWIEKRVKDPGTKEESLVFENAAVVLDDYNIGVIITTYLDVIDHDLEASFDATAEGTGGIKFTITQRPETNRKEIAYLFDNDYQAEEFADNLDEEGDFEVDIIEFE